MIGRLLESTQSPGRTAGIDQRIGDCLRKCGFAHMMRAGEGREDSVLGQEFERAQVQLAITA